MPTAAVLSLITAEAVATRRAFLTRTRTRTLIRTRARTRTRTTLTLILTLTLTLTRSPSAGPPTSRALGPWVASGRSRGDTLPYQSSPAAIARTTSAVVA